MYNFRRPDAWEDPPEDIEYPPDFEPDYSIWSDEIYFDMLSEYEAKVNRGTYEVE